MKRFALAVATLGLCLAPASALQTVFTNNIIPTTAVASTQTFVIDLNAYNIDYLSSQAVYSSATISAVTFTDGAKSTGSITVNSASGLAGAQGSDTITVANNNALVPAAGTDVVDVSSNGASALNGSSITVAGSYLLVAGIDYTVGASSNATATNIATAFNNKFPNATATVVGGSVTFTCNNTGSFCNYTVTSSTPTALTVQNATFTGGNDNTTISLNGITLTQGLDWSRGSTSSATAISIANDIQNAGFGFTASTTALTVVTVKCSTKGQFCNNYTLSASTGSLTIASAKFTSGQDNAIVNINGIGLTQGTDWTAASTSSGTAKAISDAIQANTSLSAIIASTWTAAGVVKATSTVVGVNDYNMYSSTAAITVSAKFTAGKASDIDTTNNFINATAHGMPTGLAVLYTKASGTSPANLVAGTTYYVSNTTMSYVGSTTPNPNTFRLSTTQANAFTNTVVNVSTITGGGSFTITPLAIGGNLGIVWAGSNDGTNWTNLSVSSVTFTSSSAGSSTSWDFGNINYRKLQATVNAPANGAYNVSITNYGKSLNTH